MNTAELLRVCGGALISLSCLVALRAFDKTGMGTLVSSVLSFLLIMGAVSAMLPLFDELCSLSASVLDTKYATLLWRAVCICIVVHLTSDFVRGAGENTLADGVEMCGRGALFALAFPLFSEVLTLAGRFFGRT